MTTERTEATAHDVAKYILEVYQGRFAKPMSVMKLHKLLYYSQAWSLAWEEGALFPETIEAWAYGPVVPDIYRAHRGTYELIMWSRGDTGRLSADHRDTVERVVKFYGKRPATWLSDLTHREKPWRHARRGIPAGERGHAEITKAALADFYGSLARE